MLRGGSQLWSSWVWSPPCTRCPDGHRWPLHRRNTSVAMTSRPSFYGTNFNSTTTTRTPHHMDTLIPFKLLTLLILVSSSLENVATVLLDLACLSFFCFFISFQTDWMMMRSDLCVEHWLLSDSLCKQKSHWIITINGKRNVWKCKLIFPIDILQLEITGLNGSYDAISSFPFSLECFKLFVHR